MSEAKNLIQVFDAEKSFGGKTLFSGASFSVDQSEHIGVIGPNGAGKSTLFKLLTEELELDQGDIIRSNDLRLGYLEQHENWSLNESVESYLSRDLVKPIWELKKIGAGLGLDNDKFGASIGSLSGGFRMRVKLLRMIGLEPNLMLLDEPTNYLDLETLLVLEEFLQNYSEAFLLISHDREFLRKTTEHILEVENGEFTKYKGDIDSYFDQKALVREQLEKRAASVAAQKKRALDFAAKFGAKASKARQAQSRLKRASKIEEINVKPLPIAAKIQIPAPPHAGKLALELREAFLGYGEEIVLGEVSFKLAANDHIGVVGFNGAGKSTLLKALANRIKPLSGTRELGYQHSVAYYAQHVAEELDESLSVLESLSLAADSSLNDQDVKDLAGSLLFSGDEIRKPISVLSGGERSRVALGKILLSRPSILLLDEPTNHLDFYTVEALTQALKSYSGCIVAVSHDRAFISRVSKKIFEIKNHRVNVYPGSYDSYVWSLRNKSVNDEEQKKPGFKLPPKPAQSSGSTVQPQKKPNTKALDKEKRDKKKSAAALEKKIQILQSRIEEQAESLAALDPESLKKANLEMAASQRKVEELEADYLKVIDEIDRIEKQISQIKSS